MGKEASTDGVVPVEAAWCACVGWVSGSLPTVAVLLFWVHRGWSLGSVGQPPGACHRVSTSCSIGGKGSSRSGIQSQLCDGLAERSLTLSSRPQFPHLRSGMSLDRRCVPGKRKAASQLQCTGHPAGGVQPSAGIEGVVVAHSVLGQPLSSLCPGHLLFCLP